MYEYEYEQIVDREQLVTHIIRVANKYHTKILGCKEPCFEDYHIFIVLHYLAYGREVPKRFKKMKHLCECVRFALNKLSEKDREVMFK